jgi:hypothetical protein
MSCSSGTSADRGEACGVWTPGSARDIGGAISRFRHPPRRPSPPSPERARAPRSSRRHRADRQRRAHRAPRRVRASRRRAVARVRVGASPHPGERDAAPRRARRRAAPRRAADVRASPHPHTAQRARHGRAGNRLAHTATEGERTSRPSRAGAGGAFHITQPRAHRARDHPVRERRGHADSHGHATPTIRAATPPPAGMPSTTTRRCAPHRALHPRQATSDAAPAPCRRRAPHHHDHPTRLSPEFLP